MSIAAGRGAQWIGVEGELKALDEPHIGALEAGASVGWGVFTTGAIKSGRPLLLARHLQRLRNDAIRSRLLTEDSDVQAWDLSWSQMLERLIEANAVERGLFRLTLCARGEGRWHLNGPPRALVGAIPGELEALPVAAWLSPYHIDARRPLSGVKSTSYAPWQIMALEAAEHGCGEALYRDSNGSLCEGARSSLFWRRGLEVFTPALSTGCLPGIARALLCSWLSEPNSPWVGREVHAGEDELSQADEIFLSSATLGPRPVTLLQNDDDILWRGAVGPACAMLRERWHQEMEEDAAQKRLSST